MKERSRLMIFSSNSAAFTTIMLKNVRINLNHDSQAEKAVTLNAPESKSF